MKAVYLHAGSALSVGFHRLVMYFGNVCQTGLPSLARPGVGGPQPSPEPKPRLPFRLLPAFSEMDHIHKALIGPGFRLSTPLKRKSSSCGVCRLRFNSEVQASSHYGGTKHAKRIKAMDTPLDSPETPSPPLPLPLPLLLSPPAPPVSVTSNTTLAAVEAAAAPPTAPEACPAAETTSQSSPGEPSLPPGPRGEERETQRDGEAEEPEAETTESEEEKARRLLYCSLCKVAVNSASQLQAHNSGTKHKTMLEARSGDGAIKSFPRGSGVKAKLAAAPPEVSTGLQNKTFHCEICDVHVNSETQLKQHISSRRHKDRAAGKPAKPKFSPYATPPQRLQSLQAVGLALRKEQELLTKQPLASCLLQRHLSVAAAMSSLTSAFHLRPASNAGPALFGPQPLPQALLHHAPASTPVCSAHHAPVLFSPY